MQNQFNDRRRHEHQQRRLILILGSIAACVCVGVILVAVLSNAADTKEPAKPKQPPDKGKRADNSRPSLPQRERQKPDGVGQPSDREESVQRTPPTESPPNERKAERTSPPPRVVELDPPMTPPQAKAPVGRLEAESPTEDTVRGELRTERCSKRYSAEAVGTALAHLRSAVTCPQSQTQLQKLQIQQDIDKFLIQLRGASDQACPRCSGSGIVFEPKNYGAIQALAKVIACAELNKDQENVGRRIRFSEGLLDALLHNSRVAQDVRNALRDGLRGPRKVGDGIVFTGSVTATKPADNSGFGGATVQSETGSPVKVIFSRPQSPQRGQCLVIGDVDKADPGGRPLEVYGIVFERR